MREPCTEIHSPTAAAFHPQPEVLPPSTLEVKYVNGTTQASAIRLPWARWFKCFEGYEEKPPFGPPEIHLQTAETREGRHVYEQRNQRCFGVVYTPKAHPPFGPHIFLTEAYLGQGGG